MRLFHFALLGGIFAAGPLHAQWGGPPAIMWRGEARTATVETVDQRARQVLLRGLDGGLHTFNVGPEIGNLAQLRPNDVVSLEFGEAVVLAMANPGDGADALMQAALGEARARPGLRPGAGAAQAFRVRVAIDAIDPRTGAVSFTGPLGVARTAWLGNAQILGFLRTLRPGQPVDLVYAETVVISARPRR